MDAESIVLEDTELLAELCGPNDYNLSIIADLLGSRVLSRGNELMIESGDEQTRTLFSQLIETLTESIKGGLPATPDLIIALHAELTPLGSPEAGAGDQKASCDDFFDACVQIPGSNQTIYPRSKGQGLYLKGMATHDLSFAVGPAGTGKTYLAMAWALKDLLGKAKRKLILTRPIVEAGESLGYLPGDLVQKINPYLRPLYDAMEMLIPYESIRRLEETRSIEVAPLAYMRGRSLNNCVVILDEAQNTTKEQMKMFLTRLGENTKAIVTGDITQIDLPRKAESGLVHALQILSSIEGIFISHLDSRDVVRSRLVRKIIEAYENE
ncbi:MAG: PhoH family protein [Spirochaetia bacterium]|uniref:PhoH-like protein n=2 Tax=root TaxID=1 RepID=A0A652ZXZ5_9SPIR|nr:PhoH family protein [Spirochaetia bacterium]MCE1209625.1 PhoH family protein [Spirochaetia bacterium]NLX44411.1 PhoH family protein [Treponema sp.]VBB40678.1 putative enzyme with nucleoside triphosphate hydrolase domain [uncultured Spirochaetota bacterium]HOI22619.1 PhoH family protein [Spirochaetales bacterium]